MNASVVAHSAAAFWTVALILRADATEVLRENPQFATITLRAAGRGVPAVRRPSGRRVPERPGTAAQCPPTVCGVPFGMAIAGRYSPIATGKSLYREGQERHC
jgi:hypothetical protein